MQYQPMSYEEICRKFAELGIKSRISMLVNDSVEEATAYLMQYGDSTKLNQGEEFYYLANPEVFLKNAYSTLCISSFGWIDRTKPALEAIAGVTSRPNALFFDAFNLYLCRCSVHNSLQMSDFNEAVNYFVKTDEEGVSPLKGPFEKVPSTFFGGEELNFWDIDFPKNHDTIVVYTNEGILRMIMRYAGKTTRHY